MQLYCKVDNKHSYLVQFPAGKNPNRWVLIWGAFSTRWFHFNLNTMDKMLSLSIYISSPNFLQVTKRTIYMHLQIDVSFLIS